MDDLCELRTTNLSKYSISLFKMIIKCVCFFPQKLKKEIHHETNGEKTNGEKTNGEKTNGEKTNGEKVNGEKTTNGEVINGVKQEDSPPPVKKQTDSSLADIEEAIPDTTNDQKIMDRVLDKTRCVSLLPAYQWN